MSDGQRSTEARVEELVELERELRTRASGDASGVYEEGTIAGAERVPAGDVPADYPVPIETDQALRIDVETTGGIVETYVEWAPRGDGQGHVDRLLEVLDKEPAEFADIFGDRVALDYREGYHSIDPDGTARLTGDGTDATGLGFGLDYDFRYSGAVIAVLVAAAAAAAQLYGPGTESGSFLLFSVLGSFVLPLAVAFDGKRVGERTGWTPLVPAWAVGAFVPIFNVPIATAYLLRRRAERRPPGRGRSTWATAILVVGLSSVGLLPVVALAEPTTAVPLYVFVTVLLPMAVAFDLEVVAPDRTIARAAWAAGTAALSLFFAGFLAAGAYLYYRARVLDA